MDDLVAHGYSAVMRNLCSILIVFMFMAPAWGADKEQPDAKTRIPLCQPDLRTEEPRPGYSNTSEEDRRRIEPGPDEVEDRNPGEFDAYNPGGF